MHRFLTFFVLPVFLASCGTGTNPFQVDTPTTTSTDGTSTTTTDTPTTTTTTGAVIDSDGRLLPGTTSPSATDIIFRVEARDTADATAGNGYAESFRYDADTNTFFVDNLAFDGDNGYSAVTRTDALGNTTNLGFGPFNVYGADAIAVDSLTSADIEQMDYRALYGVSTSGNSEIAIVRTGGYIQYGFGGYIYQRNTGVTLPTSGSAQYDGSYAGLRDFNGQGGIEYVVGDAQVIVDFDDFNDGSGVRGYIRNRRVYADDANNTDITNLITGDLGITNLPVIQFVIEADALDSNGEATGTAASLDPRSGGYYEEGTYYALVSGENAEEIAGVIVTTTALDPRYPDINVRETGGFFAYRVAPGP